MSPGWWKNPNEWKGFALYDLTFVERMRFKTSLSYLGRRKIHWPLSIVRHIKNRC